MTGKLQSYHPRRRVIARTLDAGRRMFITLFFTHYSFFGFDPHSLHDRFTSSCFENNRNIALINRAYCMANPKHFYA